MCLIDCQIYNTKISSQDLEGLRVDFETKLSITLNEMALRHHVVAGDSSVDTPGGRPPEDPQFGTRSYKGYTSPRYIEAMSNKLSRLTKYNINIFVIDGTQNSDVFYPEYGTRYLYKALSKPSGSHHLPWISEVTGVPINEMVDAINIVMTGDRAQAEFTPWIYIHQIAEAIRNTNISVFDKMFAEPIKSLMEIVGPDWKSVFKMGSVRDKRMFDVTQEITTEYLWHGGRIRYNDFGDPRIGKIISQLEDIVSDILDSSIGGVFYNDAGF